MVICPGIGNHSEKHYIRTFVDHAQKDGYRCAVLNHLGALPNIELTSPRMFTYGEAKELTSVLHSCHLIIRAAYWQESGDTIRIMIQGLRINILRYCK